MGNYYGDNMLLKELIELTGINLALSKNAEQIEIADDFLENYSVTASAKDINIKTVVDDVTRVVNFNFEKDTISEVFASKVCHGGIIYSSEGVVLKIIN